MPSALSSRFSANIYLAALLMLSSVVAVRAVFGQVRYDWTNRKLECARSLGIDLKRPTSVTDPNFARHLTWLAPIVVLGKVDQIEYHAEGCYGTTVQLSAIRTWKGELAEPALKVKLVTGPRTWAAWESSFALGETVIVFPLQTNPTLGDEKCSLKQDEYILIDGVKLAVEDDTVRFSDVSDVTYSLPDVVAAIGETAVAQQSECRSTRR